MNYTPGQLLRTTQKFTAYTVRPKYYVNKGEMIMVVGSYTHLNDVNYWVLHKTTKFLIRELSLDIWTEPHEIL